MTIFYLVENDWDFLSKKLVAGCPCVHEAQLYDAEELNMQN